MIIGIICYCIGFNVLCVELLVIDDGFDIDLEILFYFFDWFVWVSKFWFNGFGYGLGLVIVSLIVKVYCGLVMVELGNG